MKYLKKFENFESEEYMSPENLDMDEQDESACKDEMCQEEEEEDGYDPEVTLEKKKLPAGLKAYLDKKRKSGSKSISKGKDKPDFFDKGDKIKKSDKEVKSKKK